ncbi:MAG: hypothetical protein J6Y37_04300 [Paludibacteraceae bacterium]|nr:hypothetical protein [Paludibacteraceae bacterium]
MGWSTILVINEEGVSYHSGNLAAVFKNIKEDDISNHSSSLVADFKWNEIKEIRYYVDGGTHNLDITLHSGKLCTLFLGSLEFDFLSWRLVRKIQSFSHNSEIIKYKKRHLYGLR